MFIINKIAEKVAKILEDQVKTSYGWDYLTINHHSSGFIGKIIGVLDESLSKKLKEIQDKHNQDVKKEALDLVRSLFVGETVFSGHKTINLKSEVDDLFINKLKELETDKLIDFSRKEEFIDDIVKRIKDKQLGK